MSDANTAFQMSDSAAPQDGVRSQPKPVPSAGASIEPHPRNLDMVMDIPVTLSMELGRTRISIRDLLKLTKGSVVELQRMADEPMDVLVNGTLVARGEAVVIDDKFGIRLTDVVSPMERVKRLR